MAKIDWVKLVEERLLQKGMSLHTDFDILVKDNNKIFFNQILKDLVNEYPNEARLHYIILSMRNYHDVEDIYGVLDEQNKHVIEIHASQEENMKRKKSKYGNRKK